MKQKSVPLTVKKELVMEFGAELLVDHPEEVNRLVFDIVNQQ